MRTAFTILLIAASVTARAQYDSVTLHNNPGIQSKGIAFERSKEKKFQETTLPNLEVTAGVFIKPMVLPMGNQVAQFTAMQMFPWFGTYESIRTEARAMEAVAYEQYVAERNTVVYNLTTTTLSLYKLKKKKALEEKRLEFLLAIEDFMITRYASSGTNQRTSPSMGMTSSPGTGMSQLLQLRMEVNALKNQLHTLDDDFALESIRYNLLLNRNTTESIEIPDTLLLLSTPNLSDTDFSNSPAVKMIEAERRAAEASEQMAVKMGAPMVGAGLNYMVMRKPSGGDFPMADGKNMIMPMVSVSLPIYRKKFTALKKEAQLNQASLGKQLEQVKNDLTFDYQEAQQMKKVAERNLTLAHEQIELAENTVALLLTEYTANQVGYDEVLRMKSQVLMLKVDALDALVEYNTAISKIDYLLNTY